MWSCRYNKVSGVQPAMLLTLIYIKLVLGDPRTKFSGTSFTRKLRERSDSIYSSILMPENIRYHHFTCRGPNSTEIVNENGGIHGI